MSAEQKVHEWIGGERWFGPRDSTWTQIHKPQKFAPLSLTAPYPAENRWGLLDPMETPSEEGYDCRNVISSRFEMAAHETLLFTVGRAEEACNDEPLLVWKSHDALQRVGRLPDLFDYNVESIWYTGRYLIMGIKATYESGGSREGLAFWNLDQGVIRSVVAQTHVGTMWEEDRRRGDPTQGLGIYLRDLNKARIGESGGIVYVQSQETRLAFWPERQEWTVIP